MWKQLGREDFDKTSEFMGGRAWSVTWQVCEKYELEQLQDEDLEGGKSPYGLVAKYPFEYSKRHKWSTYAPLDDTPDLFLRFARLYAKVDQTEAMIDWVHRYGVIGHDGKSPSHPGLPQCAKSFSEEVEQAAGVLALYETVLNRDGEKAKSVFLEFPSVNATWRASDMLPKPAYMDPEERAKRISQVVEEAFEGDYLQLALHTAAVDVEIMVSNFCNPGFILEQGSRRPSDVKAGWNFVNLLGAMYLQMYWLMGAGGNITRCEYCGQIISLAVPAPNTRKTRQDKKFCNDACRQRHYYHTKTKPRRQGK